MGLLESDKQSKKWFEKQSCQSIFHRYDRLYEVYDYSFEDPTIIPYGIYHYEDMPEVNNLEEHFHSFQSLGKEFSVFWCNG